MADPGRLQLALRIPTPISRGETGDQDKALIRQTSRVPGCDPKHVWTTKKPDAGVLRRYHSCPLLEKCLASPATSTAYTDPRTPMFVAARLFLELA